MRPEDQYHEAQEREWSLLLAEAGDPGVIIVSKPPYEDNGSGINPEW